jgi:hypothetical protein
MSTLKVINSDSLAAERRREATRINIYSGTAKNAAAAREARQIGNGMILAGSENRWESSEGFYKLANEIEDLQKKVKNAAQAPDSADIQALIEKIFIDITRRAQEAPDLTSRLYTELVNPNYLEQVNMREILPYRGEFKEIAGSNDSVPLIEEHTAETDFAMQKMYALGAKTSIKNILFNPFHSQTKVTQAAVDAYTDKRNALTIGSIVGATYVASQKQAADTVGGTYDMKIYNTVRKAIKKLRGLKDLRTDRKISVPRIAILCNSADAWDIQRAIYGQLTNGGANGVLTTQNAQSLPIAEIIEYDQGINDGFLFGKDTMSYPGVTQGTFYVFVPREYAWALPKRTLTLETGEGSVLQLSTEERAWYFVQAQYDKIFFGSSYAGTSLGAGYGAIIEAKMPTDS